MTERESLDVIVEFYPPKHGGRAVMPNLISGQYRPHIVVNRDPDKEYLGVVFYGGPPAFEPGEEVAVQMRLVYDKVDYSALTPDIIFLIKEGARTVGEGVVV